MEKRNILLIGNTGDGKSTLGNRILQKEAFSEGDGADYCTAETNMQAGAWGTMVCNLFDTPGANDSKGLNAERMGQMVEYVKAHASSGVNAIFLVFNAQAPRFGDSLKRMIKLYINMLNTKEFWTHLGIVFSKCFATGSGKITDAQKSKKKMEFTGKLHEMFREIYPSLTELPVIPCFCLDSKDNDDPQTKDELTLMQLWVKSKNSLSSSTFVVPDQFFWRSERRTRERPLGPGVQVEVGSHPVAAGSHQSRGFLGTGLFGHKVTDYVTVKDYKVQTTYITEERVEGVGYDGEIRVTDWREVPGSRRVALS